MTGCEIVLTRGWKGRQEHASVVNIAEAATATANTTVTAGVEKSHTTSSELGKIGADCLGV
jgi:hypothetical protein